MQTSDPVERLRASMSCVSNGGIERLCHEAADEIERLRAALERIDGIATNWNKDGGTLLSALGAVQFHARAALSPQESGND